MTTAVTRIEAAGAVQTTPATFDEFVSAWFSSDEMFRVREQSKKSYAKSLKAFKAWLTAQGIAQPTKQNVKDWCNAMDAEGLSPATKNLRLTTVRNFAKWLSAEYGLVDFAAGLKGWKDTKEHKRGYLSIDEMRKLVNVIDTSTLQGKRDKAIIGVMLAGGLRTIEINRLHIADVVHSGGQVFLNVLGKGRDAGELVKISRQAAQLIRDWLTAREAVDVVSDDSPLFCSLGNNSFGEPLSSNSVSTLCKKYLTAAGLKSKEIVAHSLRHSLATNSILGGASLLDVQQQLRHQNVATTLVYVHEANRAANRCTDIISNAIF